MNPMCKLHVQAGIDLNDSPATGFAHLSEQCKWRWQANGLMEHPSFYMHKSVI